MSADVSMAASPLVARPAAPSESASRRPARMSFGTVYKGRLSEDAAQARSGRFSAPSGLSDSEDDAQRGPAPSFSMQAPTGHSDGESESGEDEGEVTSRPKPRSPVRLQPPGPADQLIAQLQTQLRTQMLVTAQQERACFEAEWREIELREAQEFAEVEAFMLRKRAALAGAEAARQAQLAESQKKLMSGLQQEHSSQAAAMERQAQAAVRQAEAEQQRQEEIRRQAEAVRKAEAEAAQQAERAALAKKEEAAKHEQQQRNEQAAAAAAQAKQDAERRSSGGAAGSSSDPAGVRIAPEAAEFERTSRAALQKAQEAAQRADGDAGQKAEKRAVYRRLNKLVAQIGGTQQQVDAKSGDIVALLNGMGGGLKAFTMLQLAQGFIDLSEGVDSRFPAAEVAVNVGNAHPDFVPILLGKLHEVCPLAVPKCYVRLKGESADAYLRRWGFQRVEAVDRATGQAVETWEDAEVFLRRVTAHVQLYAAFLQSDGQRTHGAEHGWAFLARLLNALPPGRYTAFALAAFVDVAGYKMHCVYRRQFVKLLVYVDQCFLAAIVQQGLEEARSAVRRLRQYLQAREFASEPAGRRLEMYDASTYDRA